MMKGKVGGWELSVCGGEHKGALGFIGQDHQANCITMYVYLGRILSPAIKNAHV